MRSTGRTWRRLAAPLAFATLAAVACSPIDSAPEGSETGAGDSDPVEVTEGGTLTVGRTTDLISTSGSLTGAHNYSYIPQVFDSLVRYDENGEPQPELASSWELREDSTQLHLALRDDVTFHDGREFTAADVAANLERVRDPDVEAHQVRQMAEWIEDVEILGDYELLLHLDDSRPAIIDMLDLLFIVDVETADDPDTVIGTGPFEFVEWEPGDHFTLTRNDEYWRADEPRLDEIVVEIFSDAPAMMVQLESGAIDRVELPPEREAARLSADPGYTVQFNARGTQFYYLIANTTIEPLDDPQVRQAINSALNRERFVDTTLSGVGAASPLPWPEHSRAFHPEDADAYPFDLDEARNTLEAAGVDDLELGITVNADVPALVAFAEILQNDLAQIGVTAEVHSVELALWREELLETTFPGLLLGNHAFSNYTPASLFSFAAPYRGESNPSGFDSDEYRDLIAQASTAATPEDQAALEDELTQLLLNESFVMPLSPVQGSVVFREGFGGAEFRNNGMIELSSAGAV